MSASASTGSATVFIENANYEDGASAPGGETAE